MYVYIYKCTRFAHWQALLFGQRAFARALGCGARKGGARALWCKFGARPGSVARTLGIQSRELAFFHEIIAFRDAEAPRTMETPQFQLLALLLLYHTVPPALKLSTLR